MTKTYCYMVEMTTLQKLSQEVDRFLNASQSSDKSFKVMGPITIAYQKSQVASSTDFYIAAITYSTESQE